MRELLNKFGKLKADESTFNKNEMLLVSNKYGICGRFNENDFETKEKMKIFLLLISKAPEMLEMLELILEGKCDIPEWKKEKAFKLIKEATEL
jgi:hypothetical protein